MAAKKLTAPNGAVVSVDSDKVEGLLRRGFTDGSEKKAPTKKTAAKKASSSNTSNS